MYIDGMFDNWDLLNNFSKQVRDTESRMELTVTKSPVPTDQDRLGFQNAKMAAREIQPKTQRLHFKFDRSLTGEELATALKQSLSDNGIDPDSVLIRYFEKNRLSWAVNSGTDRDETTQLYYGGLGDDETIWMRELGIYGMQNVTYASSLGSYLTGGANAPKSHNLVYVIYDKNLLHKVGHASNGFHAFLTSPDKACIGFLSDEGTIPLSRPGPSPSPEGPKFPS